MPDRPNQSVLRSLGEALTFGVGMVGGLAIPTLAWAHFGTWRAILAAAVLLGVVVLAVTGVRAYGVAAGITLGTFLSVLVLGIVAATPML